MNQTLLTIGRLLESLSIPVNLFSISIGLGFTNILEEHYYIIGIIGLSLLITGHYVIYISKQEDNK